MDPRKRPEKGVDTCPYCDSGHVVDSGEEPIYKEGKPYKALTCWDCFGVWWIPIEDDTERIRTMGMKEFAMELSRMVYEMKMTDKQILDDLLSSYPKMTEEEARGYILAVRRNPEVYKEMH